MLITLLSGVVLMVLKFTAWRLTGSNAVLSDASESIINILAGGVALFSIYFSSRPRDLTHPYGHGKIEFFTAGMEGTLISIASLIIIGKAVYGFIDPKAMQDLSLGTLLVLVSSGGNWILGQYLIKTGKKHHSLTLQADGKHLMSDVYSSLGLAIGLGVMQITHIYWLDGVLAIGFALFILYSGYELIRDAVAGLMDESDPKLINRVVEVMNSHRRPLWIDIHNMRVQNYGKHLHVDCHLTLPFFLTVEAMNTELLFIEKIINQYLESDVEVFIHVEPCTVQWCSLCLAENCPKRNSDFNARPKWTAALVMKNEPIKPEQNS